PAATFLVGFDSEPIRAEKSLFEIAGWLRERPALASAVLEAGGERVVKRLGHFDDSEWADFSARLQAHLDMYGHAVYNLDFVNPVPADDPAPLVDTLRFLLRGEGSDPYERQQRLAARRERATSEIEGRLDPL